ncbi:uncharacterized protein LOC141915418 [Tubulanus polymorphus]|uniref:uncharacterized protein LOC141915418 n=1 Tax=Tubulanus polymorphus TaxID=672921 RepID=UPI003DA59DE0
MFLLVLAVIFVTFVGAVIWSIQKILTEDLDEIPSDVLESLGKYGRRMGSNECFYEFENGHKNLYDSNVIFLESKVRLSQQLVVRSLAYIWKRHPLLRCKIFKYKLHSRKIVMFFKEMTSEPQLDFKVIDTLDWQEVLHEEFQKEFNSEQGPLWRSRMLQGELGVDNRWRYSFVFTFHHAIVDGAAIVQIYREFIQNLEILITGSEPAVESLPMMPCVEDVFADEMKLSMYDKLKHYVLYAWQNARNAENTTEIGKNMVKTFKTNEKPSTKLFPIQFDTNETGFILRKCKEQGVRVHSLCTMAVATALLALLDKYHVETNQPLRLVTAHLASLRNFGRNPVGNDTMGTYISMPAIRQILKLPSAVTKRQFWKMAEKFQSRLYRHLNKEHMKRRKLISLQKSITEESVAVSHLLREEWQRPFDIVMFNRGHHKLQGDDSEERPIKFLNTFFGIGANNDYTTHLGHYICTVDGRMSWTFQYRSQLMSTEVAADYCRLIKMTLFEYCE